MATSRARSLVRRAGIELSRPRPLPAGARGALPALAIGSAHLPAPGLSQRLVAGALLRLPAGELLAGLLQGSGPLGGSA